MSLWSKLTYPFRRGPRRPLAARRPSRAEMGQDSDVPLGMEAVDMDLVNKVNRRNATLERVNWARINRKSRQNGSFMEATNREVDPMPDDETYAARFHRVFHKKGK